MSFYKGQEREGKIFMKNKIKSKILNDRRRKMWQIIYSTCKRQANYLAHLKITPGFLSLAWHYGSSSMSQLRKLTNHLVN